MHASIAGDLGALASRARPNEVSCALASSGFRDLDQALFISRPKNGSPSAILRVWSRDDEPVTHEAPLDDPLARLPEEISGAAVEQRASCTHGGLDGVWYLIQAPGGARSAITWSPQHGTKADSVVDTFMALRAYVTSPETLHLPAMQTLRREAYATHHRLGLFDKERTRP